MLQAGCGRGDRLNAPAGVSLTRTVNPGETIVFTRIAGWFDLSYPPAAAGWSLRIERRVKQEARLKKMARIG